jgi:hypothetical protein
MMLTADTGLMPPYWLSNTASIAVSAAALFSVTSKLASSLPIPTKIAC